MKSTIKYICNASLLSLFLIAHVAHTTQAQQRNIVTRPDTAAETTNKSAQTPATNTPPAPLDLRVRATERAIDASIPNDPAVETVIGPYSAKVRALNVVIGKLSGSLKKEGIGGGSLGNFVADAIRDRAQVKLGQPVLLAITNTGGLRKNEIAAGDLRAMDIYELLPFENAVVALDLTGEQLRRLLDVVVDKRDAQSGARITYRTNAENRNEIVNVKLGEQNVSGKEIDPATIYTIVTIDYLVKRGGDYAMLQEAKNVRPLNVTMRDVVLDYVKAETAAGRSIKAKLDGRFRKMDGAGTGDKQTP